MNVRIHPAMWLVALAGISISIALLLAFAQPRSTGAASFSEVATLVGSDTEPEDYFGRVVAIDGTTAVVGAPGEETLGQWMGAAYVFQMNEAGDWLETAKLMPQGEYSSQERANFGGSVTIDGDTVVIGAYGRDTGHRDAGAAYVFSRNYGGPNNWGLVTDLAAADAGIYDGFGGSVSISGDTVIVGAHKRGLTEGAVFLFRRDEGGPNNWGQVAKATPAPTDSRYDYFGTKVSIGGDTAVVGGSLDGESYFGAAYILQRDEGGADNWGIVRQLTGSGLSHGSAFGHSVSIDGDVVLVGATSDSTGGGDAGAAYIFERNAGGAGNWGEVKKFYSSEVREGESFGRSVSLSGDSAVVSGAWGAAYQFERNQGGTENWGEVARLTASEEAPDSAVSGGLASSGKLTVIGGPVNYTVGVTLTGAAYVFDLEQIKPTATPSPTPTPGPQMTLDVTLGGICDGDDCYAGTSSTFTLDVVVKNPPPTGYVLMQTFLDYGLYDPTASEDGAGPHTCGDRVDNNGDGVLDRDDPDCVTLDLAYVPSLLPADEIVWPGLDPRVAFRLEPGMGYLSHGGITGLTSPLPESHHEGAVVAVEFRCPPYTAAAPISLLPYFAPRTGTSGSALVEGGGSGAPIPVKTGAVTMHCIEPTAGDYDGDGCNDAAENGSSPAQGGDRNFVNPWDFYDVAGLGGANVPDGVIDVANDYMQVAIHYSPTGYVPGQGYEHYDRGPATGNSWKDTQPPDGVIDLANDLLGVIQQIGHTCL